MELVYSAPVDHRKYYDSINKKFVS